MSLIKEKNNLFLPLLSFLLLSTLAACGNKGAAPEGAPLGPAGEAGTASLSCPSGSFKLVNPQKKNTTVATRKSLYSQYTGHRGGYITTLAVLEENGQAFTAKNVQGSSLQVFKNDVAAGSVIDFKSPILSAKIVHTSGESALTLFVGTLSNLQRISLDANTGAPQGNPSVFDAVGGVVSIDVLEKDVVVATLEGDVVKLSSSAVASQGGCATIHYQASTSMESDLNRPMKAFRVAVAGGKIYFLTRNYGMQEESADSFFNFLGDIVNDPRNFLKWKTQLKMLKDDGSAADLPTALDNYRLTLAQDLTSNGDRVFYSFAAFPTREVDGLLNCINTPANCGGANPTQSEYLIAMLLNVNSGIMSYKDSTATGPFTVTPTLAINDSGQGCPAPIGTGGCIRIPNMGLFYKTVLSSSSNNYVYMRGLFGYARLKGNQVAAGPGSANLEMVSGFSASPPPIGLGIPFKGMARGDGMELPGFLIKLLGGPGCTLCNTEKGTVSGAYPNPLALAASFADELKPDNLVIPIGAGHSSAYTLNFANNSFKRNNLADPADDVEFKAPTEAGFNGTLAALPTVLESDNGLDRIIGIFKDGFHYSIATYESNDANPKYHSTPPDVLPPGLSLAMISPIAYQDDLVIIAFNYNVGLLKKHVIYIEKITWPNTFSLIGLIDNQDDHVWGIRNVEKIGNHFKVYLLTRGGVLSLKGVNVMNFDYDAVANTIAAQASNPMTIAGLKGADGFSEKIYALLDTGDIKIYNANTGAEEKNISNPFGLASGQKVSFGFINARSGKIIATALGRATSTLNPTLRTISVDLGTFAPTLYDLNGSLLTLVSKSKFLFSTSILNPNSLEAFDTNKPLTGPNVAPADAAGTGPLKPASGLDPQGGVTPATDPHVKEGGDGCSLQISSFSNSTLLGWMILSFGWLTLASLRVRKKTK